ncbi:3'-5' DNA helicase [Salvia divinorum]|uniref:3'-5' DNA helicase n=1 Tax=Salvia divinorum TaxID=28513 RepID=A0ABD1I7N2_SALDI
MSCFTSAAIFSPGNSCSISTSASLPIFNKSQPKKRQNLQYGLRIRASSADDADDCNEEECAPEKEVGKVSMEWVAREETRVIGTFPPRKKGWTGYVEKDTAGQTNIYSVEPAVYIAESAISSGTAGSSSEGAENTVAIVAGIGLFSVAAASVVLLQVGNKPAVVQTVEYSGPSLSYYINKFTPPVVQQTVEVSAPPVQTETSVAEVSQPEVLAGDSLPPPSGPDTS